RKTLAPWPSSQVPMTCKGGGGGGASTTGAGATTTGATTVATRTGGGGGGGGGGAGGTRTAKALRGSTRSMSRERATASFASTFAVDERAATVADRTAASDTAMDRSLPDPSHQRSTNSAASTANSRAR